MPPHPPPSTVRAAMRRPFTITPSASMPSTRLSSSDSTPSFSAMARRRGKCLRESGQQSRSPLEREIFACGGGSKRRKSFSIPMAKLGDRPRAPPRSGRRRRSRNVSNASPLDGIVRRFRLLECGQNRRRDFDGLRDTLQSGCMPRPVVAPSSCGRRRSRRPDNRRDSSGPSTTPAVGGIDPRHVAQQHRTLKCRVKEPRTGEAMSPEKAQPSPPGRATAGRGGSCGDRSA